MARGPVGVLLWAAAFSCGVENLSAPQEGGGRPEPSPMRKPAEEGLQLALHVPRDGIRLGQPVVLVVSLENISREQQEVVDRLSPEHGLLAAWLRGPGDEREAPYAPPVVRDARVLTRRILAPGERITARLPIWFGRDGWLLDRPGRWRVRAEYAWDNRKCASEPIGFEIAPAASEGERKAAARMMTPEVGRFLYLGGGRDAEGAARSLEAIARDHPDGPLAPYARLALGRFASRETFDPAIKDFRPANPARAVEELEWALSRVEDPLLAAEGISSLGRSLEAVGRPADAARARERYTARFAAARSTPGLAEEIGRAIAGEGARRNDGK